MVVIKKKKIIIHNSRDFLMHENLIIKWILKILFSLCIYTLSILFQLDFYLLFAFKGIYIEYIK